MQILFCYLKIHILVYKLGKYKQFTLVKTWWHDSNLLLRGEIHIQVEINNSINVIKHYLNYKIRQRLKKIKQRF